MHSLLLNNCFRRFLVGPSHSGWTHSARRCLHCAFIRAVGRRASLAHEPTPKKSGEFEDGFELGSAREGGCGGGRRNAGSVPMHAA